MSFDQWRHSARAWLFHFIGQDERAYAEYVVAFSHAPSAKIARSLGFIATQRKRASEGAHWFAEATKLDPSNAETWFNLGFAREHDGQRRAAIEAFSEAVRLMPTLDRAWYGKGLNHGALGEHQAAADAFERVVVLQPMHGDGWYQLGMAQQHANHPERVVEVIKQLRTFDPKRANQLIRDTGRADLARLHTDMPF